MRSSLPLAALVLALFAAIPAQATTFERRITASTDDAYQHTDTGSMSLTGPVIYMAPVVVAGYRWTNVTVPRGATITAAWIQFTADTPRGGTCSLIFQAQAADNPGTFSSSNDVRSRSRASASTNWSPPPWNARDESGSAERTPSLVAVVQQAVNRTGWASGNALVIIVSGSGDRSCWSVDGKASAAALLHIDYTTSSPPPPPPPPSSPIVVYAGYYDTHHHANLRPKPNPWQGSSNVVFVGTPDSPSGGWDASAVRIANTTGNTISNVRVTVDIGIRHYALWGTNTIPAGFSLILTQTGLENFDGSDTNPAGCTTCSPNDCVSKVSSTIPVVHVTIGSTTTNYFDTEQILNTHGVDAAGCPPPPPGGQRNDESEGWEQISTSAPAALAQDPMPSDAMRALDPPLVFRGLPNPSRGDLTIQFAVPVAGPVRLAVYDVTGRMARQVIDGELDTGEYVAHADLTGQPPGVYFMLLETPGGSRRERVMLVR